MASPNNPKALKDAMASLKGYEYSPTGRMISPEAPQALPYTGSFTQRFASSQQAASRAAMMRNVSLAMGDPFPRIVKPKRGGKHRLALTFKGNSVKRHMHDVGAAMSGKNQNNVDLQQALQAHMKTIETRGSTMEGYMLHYKPQTLTHYSRIRKLWLIDQAFLLRLTKAGLLDYAGHNPGDPVVLWNNRAFFAAVTDMEDDK